MYNISNFIALGGCCLSVYVLGPERIKGPVDNVLLFNKNSLELLLNNKYYSYIKHHDPIRSKKANIVPWEPEFNYEYPDMVRVVHNNVDDPKFKPELKKRVNVFNRFYQKFKTDKSKYFIFCIPYSMVNKGELIDNRLEECIQLLQEYKVLDRTIFIGARKSNKVEKDVWYDNYLTYENVTYLKTKYNIKYIELKDVIITRKGQKQKNKLKLQFIQKVNKLLK